MLLNVHAQSFAEKSRHGKMKKIADPGFLACEHHIYMSAGVNVVTDVKKQDEIMIIGLGGGGLCMFLHHCFPNVCTQCNIKYYRASHRNTDTRYLSRIRKKLKSRFPF